jgi:Flp pilus assembly protein TadG
MLARLARCSSGSALAEMTIVVPVAIALMAGAVDFGMGFSSQATLGKSVRDAARYLSGLPASAYCQTWAVSNATSLVTSVLPTATVTVDCSPPTCPSGQHCVNVTARFPYNSIIVTSVMAGFFPAFPSTFTLSTQHQELQVGGS